MAEKKAQFEPTYQITIDGMREYLRMAPQYQHESIDRAQEIIKDLERRSNIELVQVSRLDYQAILYHLYEKYREVAPNRLQFSDKPENFNSVIFIVTYLHTRDKTLTASPLDALQYLDVKRLVRMKDFGNNDLRYRISTEGIKYIEAELDKQHSPLSLSVKNGEWLPKKPEPLLGTISKTLKSAVQSPAMSTITPPSKIFISHSAKDENISEAFQQQVLQIALHVQSTDIFNISVPESGIKGGQDFKERIHTELKNAKAVIMLITENYRNSQVCLNEMGAAWMLSDKVPVIPFILAPITHKTVGFIHDTTQQFQLDSEDDLIKFVSDNKGADKLFDAHYNDATLNKAIKAVHKVIGDRDKPAPTPEPNPQPEPIKKGGIGSTIVEKKRLKQPAPASLSWGTKTLKVQESKKTIRENLIKKWFPTSPKTGEFYMINNNGEYYWFEDLQFHIIPNEETRFFLGYQRSKSPINLGIIESDDELELIGAPMQDIYDMPRYRLSANKTCWLEYKGRRRQVMSTSLNEKLHTDAQIVTQQQLLAIPVGNQFEM